MKIAATYENGNIFQHFGHTEYFKIFDTQDGQITCTQVFNTAGSGHCALAGFLSSLKVDVLICGGIGAGAQAALSDAGIKIYGGASGNADKAVESLLAEILPPIRIFHVTITSTNITVKTIIVRKKMEDVNNHVRIQ